MAAKKAQNQGGALKFTPANGFGSNVGFEAYMMTSLDGFLEAAQRVVEKGTRRIKNESIRRAPVDTYDLEGCHDHSVKYFSHTGVISGIVFINDAKMRASSTHSVPTSVYALYAHELIKSSMNPLAPHDLGELSQEKDMGREVGGKFMERAVIETQGHINNLLKKEFKKLFKG